MRSDRRGVQDAELPIELPDPAPERRRAQRWTAVGAPTPGAHLLHRLGSDVLASRGWPRGTELLVERGRRPQRGEVALVVDGGRRVVGELGLELGRVALRTDRGWRWLGPQAEYLGVVVQADAPLI